MPWVCKECGKLGERPGVQVDVANNQRICRREGLATLKGQVACCNCLCAMGWTKEEYFESGCLSCIRGSGQKLPPDSARRRRAKELDEQLKSLTNKNRVRPPTDLSMNKNIQDKNLEKPEITVLKVFDFDRCLFRTPDQPDWWPSRGYEEMMESLLPPLVPKFCNHDWWNEQLVCESNSAFVDPNVHSVLITYRGDAFKNRILSILQWFDIRFNETRFRPLTPFLCDLENGSPARTAALMQLKRQFGLSLDHTIPPRERHTALNIGRLLELCPNVRELQIFVGESRKDAIMSILGSVRTSLQLHVHAIPENPHPGVRPPQEFLDALAARKAVSEQAITRLHTWSDPNAVTPSTLPRPAPPAGPKPLRKADQMRLPQPADMQRLQPQRAPRLASTPATAPSKPAMPREGPLRGPIHSRFRPRRAHPPGARAQAAARRSGAGALSVEAAATSTKHFVNNRGGSKAPRGRVVAKLHPSMYLEAWEEEEEEEEEDYSDWGSDEDAVSETEAEEEEMHSARNEGGGCDAREEEAECCEGEWLQPAEQTEAAASPDLSLSCGDGGAEWEVLDAPEALSVGSDWYERDLDVMSVASDAWSEALSEGGEGGDETTTTTGTSAETQDHDYALALSLAEVETRAAEVVAQDAAWSCPRCTFHNLPKAKVCEVCLAPPTLLPSHAAHLDHAPQADSGDDNAGPALVASETLALDAPGGSDVEVHQERARAPHNSEHDWRTVAAPRRHRVARSQLAQPRIEDEPSQARCDCLDELSQGQCECDVFVGVATVQWPTTDRDANVWAGDPCPRRGLKAKVRSKFRWPQQVYA